MKCGYCDAEYILKRDAQQGESEIRGIDYLGRGAIFRAYVPQGWNVRVFDDENAFSRLAPACRGLRLDSPSGARLVFFPFSYYKNFSADGSLGLGFTLKKDYQFDPMTLIRYRRCPAIDDYAAERIREICPGAANISIQRTNDPGGSLQKRAEAFARGAETKLGFPVDVEWGRYAAELELGGRRASARFAAVTARKKGVENSAPQPQPSRTADKPSQNPLKSFIDFGMSGGLIGKMTGKNAGMPQFGLPQLNLFGAMGGPDWERGFDALLVTEDGDASAYDVIFDDFCANIQYGALYYALQDEELRSAEQAQLDGMRQRTQNSINASRQLQQTLSETSDIVTRGYEQRSQVMDDISRKRSEAIRGVNSYDAGGGRTVEASVSYERVFKNDAGDFAGSKSAAAEPGPDWVELKRK